MIDTYPVSLSQQAAFVGAEPALCLLQLSLQQQDLELLLIQDPGLLPDLLHLDLQLLQLKAALLHLSR